MQLRTRDSASGRRRRSGSAGLRGGMAGVLGAAVVLMAAPAGAAAPVGAIRSASAYWDIGDPQHTQISLSAMTSARAGNPGSIFLHVTQRFCNAATDELVYRSFDRSAPLERGSFLVRPYLRSARLWTSTTVQGTEQRVSGCANTTTFPTSFTPLGPSAVTVKASWTGVGDTRPSGPNQVTRDAVATGALTGARLNPGRLGTTTIASITSRTP